MAKKEIKNNKQKSHYFKDMKAELKKVIWPTPKQLINNTIAVIAFTLIIAVIVFVLDVCFDAINKYGITAMQEKIQSSYNSSNNEEEQKTDESSKNETEESDENKVEAEAEVVTEDNTNSSENE